MGTYLNGLKITDPSADTVVTGDIVDGTIVNADISGSAAIASSKLADTPTASNVAGDIVLRDGAGDFAAGTITAALTGNAATATTASACVGDVTVGAGKTLDVSEGTLTLADNQISGDKVEGGTIAATTITALTLDSTLLAATGAEINTACDGSVAWTDYGGTSTINGWAATPTANIWYKKLGKLVFVKFFISGTSNSTSTNFTLPYTAVNSTGSYSRDAIYVTNNGSTPATPGLGYTTPNDTVYRCYTDFNGAAWTNSGTKEVGGSFWFEATT